MEHVTSADGTRIAYERGGEGPALVLVHGTTSDHRSWERVVPALRDSYTILAMDRRGRGESGDAATYALEREFEDVVAVAAAADGPVHLLGHSYGAVCALGAAPLLDDLDHLVLYEPPLWTPERAAPDPAALDRLQRLADRGEGEAVIEGFHRDVTGSPERLERLRSASDYDRRVAAADTLPREVRGRLEYRPEPADFADLTAPTRFLLGGETADALARSTEAARELLPESELVVLEGQGHAAMNTAPDLFVSKVVEFLG